MKNKETNDKITVNIKKLKSSRDELDIHYVP